MGFHYHQETSQLVLMKGHLSSCDCADKKPGNCYGVCVKLGVCAIQYAETCMNKNIFK